MGRGEGRAEVSLRRNNNGFSKTLISVSPSLCPPFPLPSLTLFLPIIDQNLLFINSIIITFRMNKSINKNIIKCEKAIKRKSCN